MSRRQYRLLTRHFVKGFFEDDLVSPDEGMQATLAPILAAIAAPGLLVPMIWAFSYGWPYKRAEEFQALVLRHEVFLVVFPMVVVSLVAVVQWNSLYPDRRDAEVLGRLPVPTSTLFFAKLSALFVFVGLFAVAANGFASIQYPLVANMRPQPGSPGWLITFVAHVVSTSGATAFSALAVLATLGVMQLVLSARLLRTISPFVQLASVLGLVLALLMLPFLMRAVDPHGQGRLAELVSLHRLYTEAGQGTFDWNDVPATSTYEADPKLGGLRPRSGKKPAHYERAREAFPDQQLSNAVTGLAAEHDRSAWVFWCPPVWFVGWYEVLAGRGSPAARLLAGRAQLGLLLATVVAIVCYLGAYRRHVAGAMLGGASGRSDGHRTLLRRAGAMVRRTMVPDPIARAYCVFTMKTLVRSPRHRLMIGAAVGAALDFVLAGASVQSETVDPSRPSAQILSIQFILAIFLLAGARLGFAFPSVLPANSAFRFHGPDRVAPCATGARRAIVALALVPLLLLLSPIHVLLLGWRVALLHTLCGLVASLVLLEALLADFPKVPFASAYVPGRAMIRSRLTLYLMAFQAFAYLLAELERLALGRSGGIFVMLTCLCAVYASVVLRRRAREGERTLVYDEDSPDAIQTLGLSGPPSHEAVPVEPVP